MEKTTLLYKTGVVISINEEECIRNPLGILEYYLFHTYLSLTYHS